jgi:alpha-1,2-mannosyltransferase
VVVDVVATSVLARMMGTANDLFPRWYGTRAWLLGGLNPYSPAVDDGIRQAMGGAPGEPLGAFVFGFVYPGYVALLLAPLALLPFPIAATLWLLLAQVAIGAGTVLAWRARAFEYDRPTRSAVPALLVAITFPASLANLVFGQFAALVYLCLALAWWLAAQRRDVLAGCILALAAVKPSLALLPAGLYLLWALHAGRRSLLASWSATTALLAGASLLALPGWPGEFMRSTVDYARVASATSAAGLVASLVTSPVSTDGAANATRSVITAVTALLAVILIATGWRRSARRLGDALAAGILAGAWLVPPLYEWNSVLLLIPLLQWLTSAPERTGSRATRAIQVAALALCAANVAVLPLLLRWPYGSRALWPAVALVLWAVGSHYFGTQKVTDRARSSPSLPVAT